MTSCHVAVEVPDPSANYVLSELTASDFELTCALDVNDAGQVVGTGKSTSRSPREHPVGLGERPNHTAQLRGDRTGGGAGGEIVASPASDESERAALYQDGRLIEFPQYHGAAGIFAGTDSHARAINAEQLVVGHVRSRLEERANTNTRAAVFQLGHAPEVLMALGSGARLRSSCR